MRRLTLLFAALAALLTHVSVTARATVDFSGKWVFDAEHSSKTQTVYGGAMTSGATTVMPTSREVPLTPVWGERFIAKQDATSLTISRTITPASMAMTTNGVTAPQTKGDPITYSVTYLLDGSERKNMIPSPTLGRPASEMTVTAAWDGDKLVTSTWSAAANGPVRKVIRALHLNADGILLVDLTSPPMAGVAPVASTTTTAYKKEG